MSHPSALPGQGRLRRPGAIEVFVPQVFGETPITITDAMGALPSSPTMGWVFFQAGNCEFPVWAGEGSGGGGGRVVGLTRSGSATTLRPMPSRNCGTTPTPRHQAVMRYGSARTVQTSLALALRSGTTPTPSRLAAHHRLEAGITDGRPADDDDATVYTISARTAGRQYELQVHLIERCNSTQLCQLHHGRAPVIAGFAVDVTPSLRPPTTVPLLGDADQATVAQTYAIPIPADCLGSGSASWTDGGSRVRITDKALDRSESVGDAWVY